MGFSKFNTSAIRNEVDCRQRPYIQYFHHRAVYMGLHILKNAERILSYSDINTVIPNSSTITQQFNLLVKRQTQKPEVAERPMQ